MAVEIQLAAVALNLPYFEVSIAFPDSPIISELLEPCLKLDCDGMITIVSRPELRILLNEAVVREFLVESHYSG